MPKQSLETPKARPQNQGDHPDKIRPQRQPAQRWSAPLLIALLVAIAWNGWLGWQVFHRAKEAQRFSWTGPGGKRLFSSTKGSNHRFRTNCRGDDRFQLMVRGLRAWTSCPEGLSTTQHKTHFPSGVLVRFQRGRKAQARWPMPKSLGLTHTLGLAPGKPGHLAIAYRTNGVEGPMVIGIAGPKGWRFPPTPLAANASQAITGTPRGRLLGMGWLPDGRLRVVWAPGNIDDHQGIRTPIQILHITPDAPKQTKRSVVKLSTLCSKVHCQVIAATPHRNTWRWLTLQSAQSTKAILYPTMPKRPSSMATSQPSSRPTSRPTKPARTTHNATVTHIVALPWRAHRPNPREQKITILHTWPTFMIRKRVDMTIAGLLPARTVALSKRLTLKGDIVKLPIPPRFHMRLQRKGGQFVVKDGKLFLHHRWIYRRPPATPSHDLHKQRSFATMRAVHHVTSRNKQFNEGILLIRSNYKAPYKRDGKHLMRLAEARLQLQRLDAYEVTQAGIVARSPDGQCLDPATAMLTTLPNGGHWLLHPSGCHLTLTPLWQRSDHLSLLSTYRQYRTQSAWHTGYIQKTLAALAWGLCGLLLCLLLGLALTPMTRRLQAKFAPDDDAEASLRITQDPQLALIIAAYVYLASTLPLWPMLKYFL